MYPVQSPVPGDLDLAARVQKLLAPVPVRHDDEWGLDHAGSVLRHIYPNADVPIVQLSIDETQPPSFHHEIGALTRRRHSHPGQRLSYTTCMPMHGDGTHRNHTIGRSRLNVAFAIYSSPESTSHSSIMSINSEAKQNWRRPPPITTCLCCTLPARAPRPSL